MKYLTLILSILLFVKNSTAQTDSSFTLVRSYLGDIADAALDNLDNLYIVSSTGQIKKFNGAGDSVAVYNQLRNFGKLFSMDVSNPLKIILFYKDFSTIVVLDRFLANLNTIELRKFAILQPGAAGISYDGHIWIFDEYDNKLKKIDHQGNRLLESNDFRTVFNQTVSPQKIMNDNGFVYLADTTNGVFVFDNYGSFKKKIALYNWESIAVNSNQLISTNKAMITIYNPGTMLQTQKQNPFFKPYHHSFTTANKFISFSNNDLQVYQYRY